MIELKLKKAYSDVREKIPTGQTKTKQKPSLFRKKKKKFRQKKSKFLYSLKVKYYSKKWQIINYIFLALF